PPYARKLTSHAGPGCRQTGLARGTRLRTVGLVDFHADGRETVSGETGADPCGRRNRPRGMQLARTVGDPRRTPSVLSAFWGQIGRNRQTTAFRVVLPTAASWRNDEYEPIRAISSVAAGAGRFPKPDCHRFVCLDSTPCVSPGPTRRAPQQASK